MRTESLEMVRSSKPQKCMDCGKKIPARELSVKFTVEKTGTISYKRVSYHCMKCDEKPEKRE